MFLDIVHSLLTGVEVTLEVTLLAAALGCLVSFVVGISRLARHRLIRVAAGLYVEVLRGVSALVVLFWFYFALPFFGLNLSALEAGVLALGLTYGAYGAEVVRGAIVQVSRGQWEAAVALNMTRAQQLRLVILPQAVIGMLPPLGNLLVDLLKATSLVSLITLSDLTFHARILTNSIGHTTDVYAVTLGMYFVMCYVLTRLVRRLERRLSRGQDVGRAAAATAATMAVS